MVLMYSRTFSSPSASILCGVSATANSARVALLTPASVACADRTTATSRVSGLRCSSSPFGSGLALRKRLKASYTSAGVQGLGALTDFFAARAGPDLAAAFFAALSRDWLAAARLRDFLAGLAAVGFDLVRGLRMIFDMIRVY